MTNNDILRQLRYIFDYSDDEMISIFKAADYDVERWKVSDWLKKDEDQQLPFLNSELHVFLDGLINTKRGKRDSYVLQINKEITNNIILRKLKIALNLKDFDILKLMNSVQADIGKHELSAFFRNPKQSQYRDMGNQYLRNFLHGLQQKYRPNP